jgi:membrane-bound hydrogenase subunit mbhJ
MLKFWQERFKHKTLTENLGIDTELAKIRKEIKESVKRRFAGSLAIRMVDSGSCNACETECNALSNPYYDLDRLGIYFVASPRHADILLVSGVVTANMYHHLKDAYEQLPSPKWVVTIGDCTTAASPIGESFAIKGPVDTLLPVAHHIAGCPPDPAAIIAGLLAFLKKM